MAGYIEKKTIAGKTYYYLTENKRVAGGWKKIRRYLGVHTKAGFEKPRKTQPKPILSQQEFATIEKIKVAYTAKHAIGKNLWVEERDRLVSFIYNTNAIEGNPLTEEETNSVLRGKKVKARQKDIHEVENMKRCIDFLFGFKGKMDEQFLLKLHTIEMQGIMSDAGKYRNVDVRVVNYICPVWEEVPALMKQFFEWYGQANQALHPFELASLAHLKFVRVHPFRDGNGRIARLLMNFVLLKNGYPLLNIFNSEKMLYYLILQEVDAKKRHGPFVKYLYNVFGKQYKEYILLE